MKLATLETELGSRVVGVMDGHRSGDPVQGEALQDPGESEAVVAVGMGDADPIDGGDRDAGHRELPLGAFPGVEEDAVAIEAQ